VSDSVLPAARRKPAASTLLDRALALTPVIGVALVVVTFYAVEAWVRKTPWVFTDELEWTQISRSLADTGHAARRTEPIYFKSLYPYLIAPLWWIQSTGTAYAAIKYLNAIVMTSAAIPSYLLARMLVSRRAALVVALLSVAIPGMFYASSLIPEVLAYPWYALCSWLIVRALTTRRRLDVAVAALASLAALAVRSPQLFTVSISFAAAGAGLWLTGPRGRAIRRDWTRGDTLGAIVLCAGVLILFNRIFLQHIEAWHVSTQYWRGRMWDLGLRAVLALTAGMGVLPVLGGIASLRLTDRRGNPAYRAFAAYLGASIVTLCIYTAMKAAFLSTNFATLTEERNLIYLAPLLLVGSALVVESRRVDWRLVAAAGVFLFYVLWTRPFQLGYPYFEAPGLGILTMANRHFRWDDHTLHLALVVALGVSIVVLAARNRRGVAALATVLVLAWMVTAEVTTTAGSVHQANTFVSHLHKPLDWVDRATRGSGVTYLGQQIKDPNGLQLTEFWNRSIHHVYSLDGTAPGPGPTVSPDLASPDGLLSSYTGDRYVLADNGVDLQAELVARGDPNDLRLFRLDGPWKLRSSLQGVYADGWAGEFAAYNYFPSGGPGTLRVTLARTGFKGGAPPGVAELRVGPVKLVESQPGLTGVTAREKAIVRNGRSTTVSIPVASTPVRVEIRMGPSFRPSLADTRDLVAQVSFEFIPRPGATPRTHR
jgi:hypothetical protein